MATEQSKKECEKQSDIWLNVWLHRSCSYIYIPVHEFVSDACDPYASSLEYPSSLEALKKGTDWHDNK